MTDIQVLFTYRLRESEETLLDAEKMLQACLSPRSVINRAYYSMFYAVLALFIIEESYPKTSKHSGVIAIFDKEFIHTAKIDLRYSKMLHRMFDARQEGDYKDLVEVTQEEAAESVKLAAEFIRTIKTYIENRKSTGEC
jgi:uncharacterized protein (UPF0332 family)